MTPADRTRPSGSETVLRASEVGEYAYCARSWWLHRVQDVSSINVAALQSGRQIHERHGRAVARWQRQRRLALALAGLALVVAVAAVAMALTGGW